MSHNIFQSSKVTGAGGHNGRGQEAVWDCDGSKPPMASHSVSRLGT